MTCSPLPAFLLTELLSQEERLRFVNTPGKCHDHCLLQRTLFQAIVCSSSPLNSLKIIYYLPKVTHTDPSSFPQEEGCMAMCGPLGFGIIFLLRFSVLRTLEHMSVFSPVNLPSAS